MHFNGQMGPFLKSRVHADIGIMQFYIERKYRNINIISIFLLCQYQFISISQQPRVFNTKVVFF